MTRDPVVDGPVENGSAADAAAFAALFRAVYLTYHRRDGPRSGLTAALLDAAPPTRKDEK